MSSEGARVEKVNGFVVQLPQGTPKKLANDVPSLQAQVEELTKRVAQEESKRISAEQMLAYIQLQPKSHSHQVPQSENLTLLELKTQNSALEAALAQSNSTVARLQGENGKLLAEIASSTVPMVPTSASESASAVAAAHELETQYKTEIEALTARISLLTSECSQSQSEAHAAVEAAQSIQAEASAKHEHDLKIAIEAERERAQDALDAKIKEVEAEFQTKATAEKAAALAALRKELEESTFARLTELKLQLEKEKTDALANATAVAEAAVQDASTKAAEELMKVKAELELMSTKAAEELLKAKTELEMKIAASETRAQELEAQLQSSEQEYKSRLSSELAALEAAKEVEKVAAVDAAMTALKEKIDAALAERDEALALYTKEMKLRKGIHNKLLEIQGNIRVICRVRPILEVEHKSGQDVDVTDFPTDDDIVIKREGKPPARFEFDRVFAPGTTQLQVFEAVQPVCVSVLDGYNACIFAYGQTGSGKTYTMEGTRGDSEHVGVSPRAISELFNLIESMQSDWTYTLTFSMLEIYNETVRDLLDSSKGEKEKLDIRQSAEGNVVSGLTEMQVTSSAQVIDLMARGQSNRAVGSHDMNEHSSRSHSILTIVCRGRNNVDGTTTFGKLNLIDLAGSERVGKTDATGDRLKEAQNINKSLSALGDVIAALGNKKAMHVPYRNSKLTFLLQDSLGGNSKVLMFVNVSPAVYNAGETVCSLTFAARCRAVELGQAKKQVAAGGSEKTSGGSGSGSDTPDGVSMPVLKRVASEKGTAATAPVRK